MTKRGSRGLKGLAGMGVLGLALAAGLSAARADDGKVAVFAAASMKNALDAVNKACASEVGTEASISYAASSALAKQIENGAPADIFISADLDWMKYLHDKDLVKADTEKKLLGNAIVLVAPKDSTASADLKKGFDLAGLLGEGRLAMGEVSSVPAGKYGKAALESLGMWSSVENKLAQADNVRAALKLVATGEAAAGIVYATDARSSTRVDAVATFPAASHRPIVYPAALLRGAAPEGRAFFGYLSESTEARAVFERLGFQVLGRKVQ